MLGGNKHRSYDNPRETRRFGNCRKSIHVDYERFRYKDDAIHNGFEGRGGRNAYERHSDITRKAMVDVATYDGKIDATTFSD